MLVPAWQCVAQAKTKATLAKIPPQWVLPEAVLKEAASMRNITGPFIRTFLNEKEVTITEAPTAQLVRHIRSRQYTANEVALAYCKRAAFAHQLVGAQADPVLR
jgi:amidase